MTIDQFALFAATEITDVSSGTVYTPFFGLDGRVGYRVRDVDGNETFIYFNPSQSYGRGDENVFVYEGKYNDPAKDESVVFVKPDSLFTRRNAVTPEDTLREALRLAAHLLAEDGYANDPDYIREWRTISEALGPDPGQEGKETDG